MAAVSCVSWDPVAPDPEDPEPELDPDPGPDDPDPLWDSVSCVGALVVVAASFVNVLWSGSTADASCCSGALTLGGGAIHNGAGVLFEALGPTTDHTADPPNARPADPASTPTTTVAPTSTRRELGKRRGAGSACVSNTTGRFRLSSSRSVM
ncbi:MAG TPA: hypothetical protein VHV74_16055 [Pseudonocardiaceae bacterium]|nr:hypothetical protein [Pseudonocardiaceae bacterium]